MVKMEKFVFERVENIVGKRGHAGYEHFLLFPHCFLKASFYGWLKLVIVYQWVNRFVLDLKPETLAEISLMALQNIKCVFKQLDTLATLQPYEASFGRKIQE